MEEDDFSRIVCHHRVRPIPRCPGRFLFMELAPSTPPGALLALTAQPWGPLRERVTGVRDEVWVWTLNGGGLISYHRADGSWFHTLNTPHGFARKLAQLGLEAPAAP